MLGRIRTHRRRCVAEAPITATVGPRMSPSLGEPPGESGSKTLLAGLCQLALLTCRPVGLSSAAVSRVLDGRLSGVVYASDPRARKIDELQTLLGTGPGPSALRSANPVLSGDLAETGPGRADWSIFFTETAGLGVASMWVLPLQIGAVSLGTFTLSGSRTVEPQDDALAVAFKVADALTTALLLPETEAARLQYADLQDNDQMVIHQATGMVSVQMNITLAHAQLVLRAAAYAEGAQLSFLACEVVRRQRRFEPDTPT